MYMEEEHLEKDAVEVLEQILEWLEREQKAELEHGEKETFHVNKTSR